MITLFVRKIGMKNWSKTTLLKDFETKKLLQKFFRKSIFSLVKDTPSIAKIFPKCFFLTEIKLLINTLLCKSLHFLLHRDFYISRFRNSWPNRKWITCNSFVGYIRQRSLFCRWQINMKHSPWSEPLKILKIVVF